MGWAVSYKRQSGAVDANIVPKGFDNQWALLLDPICHVSHFLITVRI